MNQSHCVGSSLNVSSHDGNRSSSAAAFSSVVMRPRFVPKCSAAILLAAISISCFLFRRSFDSLPDSPSILSRIFPSNDSFQSLEIEKRELEDVLRRAAKKDGTVILTTLNKAWASPGSVIDLFLESFRIGEGTRNLLNHLVIIALDSRAYSHCRELHKHCFRLKTDGVDFSEEAYFKTPTYLKMMWRRIDFLRSVLEMGYNFVFTDANVMWFRDPFPRFYKDADFQIACDHYLGRSKDLDNKPNGGFSFVRSNNRTISFYKFWYASRENYKGFHDQDVLNFIKKDSFIFKIRLRIRFLNTAYFGGFCEPSKDLNLVCTMHANCCFGMDSKLHDLRIMLQDWRDFVSLPLQLKISSGFTWKVPQNCSLDSLRQFGESMDEEDSEPPGES